MPGYLPGDTPNATHCRGDIKFNPKNLQKLFGYCFLHNYSDIIIDSKHGDINIEGSPPPTLWYFTMIPNNPKGKSITHPNKSLQHVQIDIVYGICFDLSVQIYVFI